MSFARLFGTNPYNTFKHLNHLEIPINPQKLLQPLKTPQTPTTPQKLLQPLKLVKIGTNPYNPLETPTTLTRPYNSLKSPVKPQKTRQAKLLLKSAAVLDINGHNRPLDVTDKHTNIHTHNLLTQIHRLNIFTGSFIVGKKRNRYKYLCLNTDLHLSIYQK